MSSDSSPPPSSPSPVALVGAGATYNALTKPADDAMSVTERDTSEAVQASQAPHNAAPHATTEVPLPASRAASTTDNSYNVGTQIPGLGFQANPALPIHSRPTNMDVVSSMPFTPSQNDLQSANIAANTAPTSGSAAPAKTPRKRNTTKSPAPRVPKEKKTPAPKKNKAENGDGSEKKTKTPRKRSKKAEPKGSGPNNATPVQGSALRNEVLPEDGTKENDANAASTEERLTATQPQIFGGTGQSPASFIPSQQATSSFPRSPFLDNIKLNTLIAPGGTHVPIPSEFAAQQQMASSFPSNPYTASVEMGGLTTATPTFTYPAVPGNNLERDMQNPELHEQSAHISPPPGTNANLKSYFDIDAEPSPNGGEKPSYFATPRRSINTPTDFANAVRAHPPITQDIRIPPNPFPRRAAPTTDGTDKNSDDAEHSSDEMYVGHISFETHATAPTASEQLDISPHADSQGGSSIVPNKRPRRPSTTISSTADATTKRPRTSGPEPIQQPGAATTTTPSAQSAHQGNDSNNNEHDNSRHLHPAAAAAAAAASPAPAAWHPSSQQTPTTQLLAQFVAIADRIRRQYDPNPPPVPPTAPTPPQPATVQVVQPQPQPLTPHELRAIAAYPPGVTSSTYARLTPAEAVGAEMERYLMWYEDRFGSGGGGGGGGGGGQQTPYDVVPPGHPWARLRLDAGMPAVWRVAMRPGVGWPVGGRRGGGV
ncbi:hypothetical protein SLS58_008473 [Diplodia intermedia]|uniref:Uncharacterized protein n=1 Tax=Diplodia intermedia TaxID=856260 RepID=A0ABR3TH63_9PEZI